MIKLPEIKAFPKTSELFRLSRLLVILALGLGVAARFFPLPVFISNALTNDNSPAERYIIQVRDETKKEDIIHKVEDGRKLQNRIGKLNKTRINKKSKWLSLELKKNELNQVKSDSNVISVEKDKTRKILSSPNDTKYGPDQWNLRKISLNTKSGSMTSGWDISTGSSSTTIAVIDTGYDTSHPDMTHNVWNNSGEISGNGADDDGNGFVDDIHGYDFSCDDNNNNGTCNDAGDRPAGPDIYDTNGHGSHVSGIIGANTDNAKGIAGICWSCKIMPLKVINSFGYGYDSDIADAIYYAADNGAKVINMSLGGGGYSQMLQDAVDYAWNVKDVLVVSASGNSGSSASDSYPSGLDHSISVGATDSSDNVAGYSNTGPKMDILAPGSGIESTVPCSRETGGCGANGTYLYLDGTSMASPHAAGVVGLIRSYYPGWNAKEVRYALLKNIDDFAPSGFDSSHGFGRVNALKGLQASNTLAGDSTPPVSTLTQPSPNNVNNTFAIAGSASDANLYIYTISIARQSDGYIIKQVSGRSSVSSSTLYSLDTSEVKNDSNGNPYRVIPDGIYTVKMRVEDWRGNYTVSNTITINVNNVFPSAFSTISPANNTWANNLRPTFSWQTSTDTSSSVTYTFYLDGAAIASNLTSTSYTPASNISEGVHSWKVAAKNTSGNTTYSNTSTIGIDVSNPSNFSINTSVSTYFPTFTFNTTDAVSGVEKYMISIDGGGFVQITSPYTAGALPNGNHSVDVRAYDYAGNYTVSSTNFNINVTDTINPGAWLASIPEFVRGNYQFQGTAIDDNVVQQYVISIKRASDNVEFGQVTGSGSVTNGNLGSPFNTAALVDGVYKASMTVTDMAGNSSISNEISFTIDNTAPGNFSIILPSNNSTISSSKPSFSWNPTSDNFSSVTYDLYVDGNVITSGLNSLSYTLTSNLSDGNHNWYVSAKDVAGNTRSTTTFSFKVDTRTIFLRSKADFNTNGKVDLSDLSILAQNWQKNTSQGDANGDGKVDLTDLSILAQNWQKSF